jgi:hypothetical protein
VDGDQTADTGTVFYGQKTGKMTELMFGIFVKPVAKTTIEDLRTAAVRAREAYETANVQRNLIHDYVEEIGGHLNRFTEVTTELEAMGASFDSMAPADVGDVNGAWDDLSGNKVNLETHYTNVTLDVNTAANLSNDVDALYGTEMGATSANTKAADAENAADEATNEYNAATIEYKEKKDDGDASTPIHAVKHAETAIEKLIPEMKKMEKALVLGGTDNGTDGSVTVLDRSNGGSGYTENVVITIAPPPDNLQPTAPTLELSTGGVVNGVTGGTGGWGYFNHDPIVTVVDPVDHAGDNSATVVAVVTGGRITDYIITNQGSGYTTVPAVTLTSNFGVEPDGIPAIAGTPTLDAGGSITSITVGERGSRYDSTDLPSITFEDPDSTVDAEYTPIIADYDGEYRVPTAGSSSWDAFYHAHTVLTHNISSCDAVIADLDGWKTEINAEIAGNTSTGNYTDDLEAIVAKTAELTTLKSDLESIRAYLNGEGGSGDSNSLRGGDWNHSTSRFTDNPVYANMEAEFEKMDALFEARDKLLSKETEAQEKSTAGNDIVGDLSTVKSNIAGRGDGLTVTGITASFTTLDFAA